MSYTSKVLSSLIVRRLGSLTTGLVQEYGKELVGIDDPARWLIDSNDIDSCLQSRVSIPLFIFPPN